MTRPIDRAVRRILAIARLVARHREADDDPRAPAVARKDRDLAAELHGKAPDQRHAEIAAVGAATADWGKRIEAIVLDHQLDFLALLVGLDANLGNGRRAEVVVERPAR